MVGSTIRWGLVYPLAQSDEDHSPTGREPNHDDSLLLHRDLLIVILPRLLDVVKRVHCPLYVVKIELSVFGIDVGKEVPIKAQM